ncbi:hypothetical protein GobsT_58480 [Gemmata obscuriglobus]|nr:hypothetical protein GobsT_58480 [Gemmata obscuriglobus]VTS10364.1 unnamed protein product [Gemmata obscuriglobus UQM 2246]
MMILCSTFDRFVNGSPISVMARAAVEHALCASALDELFDRTAERGYIPYPASTVLCAKL